MRTALTIGLLRKGKVPFELLAGLEVPIDWQIEEFKKFSAKRENAKFSELQLWISDAGISKRAKFRDPKVEARTQSTAAKAEAAERARVEAEEQAKADQLAREQAEADAKEKAQFEADAKIPFFTSRPPAAIPDGAPAPVADEKPALTGLAKFNAERKAAAAAQKQTTESK